MFNKKLIPGFAWFFIINILLFLPGQELPKPPGWMDAIYFDKWVHFGLFAIAGFLLAYPFVYRGCKRRNFVFIAVPLLLSLWGWISELIQGEYVAFRSPDWTDWLADSIGALAGVAVAAFIAAKNPKILRFLSGNPDAC